MKTFLSQIEKLNVSEASVMQDSVSTKYTASNSSKCKIPKDSKQMWLIRHGERYTDRLQIS